MLCHTDMGDATAALEPFVNRAGSMAAVFAMVYPLGLPLSKRYAVPNLIS